MSKEERLYGLSLSAQETETLMLLLEGHVHAEIAKIMGVNDDSVVLRLSHVGDKIKSKLEQE
ncbi:MAG: hypothetical protein ACYC08_03930 [Armatimonadota bacterium]